MQLWIFISFMFMTQIRASMNPDDLGEFILDYIEYKNASRLLSAFLCERDFDTLTLSRKLADASVSSVLLDPVSISSTKKDIKSILNFSYHRLNVVADLECHDTEKLIMQASSNKMFNHSYAWLLIGNNESYAIELMTKLNLSVDADIVLAIASEVPLILYDVYNTGSDRNGNLNVTFIGTWNISEGLDVIELQSFVYRRQNLTGITLKFATVTAYMNPDERDLNKYLSDLENKTYDNISKFSYALSGIPRNFFNYSVEISTWHDYGGRWNGPYFGMMGALGRGEADFTLGGTVITEERLEYCTPVVQNYPFWTGFLFKHPKSHSIRNAFLVPLAPSTWNAVLVTSMLFILTITLAMYRERKCNENPWSFGIYITLATLLQQGWSISPPGFSGRILFFVFMVFSMLLYNFYSASVVSSLLSDPPQNIRTIADLLDSGIPAAFENVSYVPHYFEISTVPVEKIFWEKRLLDKGVPKVLPRPEGILRVKSGGFAYHTTPHDAYEKIAQEFSQPEICSLAEITFIRRSILALWGSRENPYTEHLKIIHRRLEEVGILAREQKRWSAPKPECLAGVTTLNSITLAEVAPAFLALLIGALLALVILVVERFYYFILKNNR